MNNSPQTEIPDTLLFEMLGRREVALEINRRTLAAMADGLQSAEQKADSSCACSCEGPDNCCKEEE